MNKFIYFNGKIINENLRSLRPNDRGLLFGDGLFETIRIQQGMPLFLARHVERLLQGTRLLDIDFTLTISELKIMILKLLKKNNATQQNMLARLTVTRGAGPREIWPSKRFEPTILLTLSPYCPPKKDRISLKIVNIMRHERSPLARIKSLNYLDNILAKREALQSGCDEAVLLNTQGRVAEAASANLFIIKSNQLFTPPITEGALPGVMRLFVFELAEKLQLPCDEKNISLAELLNADEVFLTNVNIGVLPVASIMGESLKKFPNKAITTLLRQKMKDVEQHAI